MEDQWNNWEYHCIFGKSHRAVRMNHPKGNHGLIGAEITYLGP